MLTTPEVSAIAKPSVVEIKTEIVTNGGWFGNYIAEGAGSGVIVSSDGYIATNNHVISGATSITVRLPDGHEYSATLTATDVKTDIAMLKIKASSLSPAVFGDSSLLVVGESAIAVGNPLGELGGTVTSGIISALDRDIAIDGEMMSLLQTDAAVNPGNSGGGLFNMYGELIGVVNAKSTGLDIEGLGFAIPANTARAVINDLVAYGYVRGRAYDGLELVDIQTSQAARMYRVSQAGLYIISSADSQLKSGDRITAVGGLTVKNQTDYNTAMKGRKIDETVRITVARGNQSVTIEITLTEWKP
jgi:serine protease Do